MTIKDYKALPTDQRNTALRNALNSLSSFEHVEIFRERDHHVEHATGEDTVPWTVCINGTFSSQPRIEVKDDALEDAIIQAEHEASEVDGAEYQKQQANRYAALAKLTPEERRLLGL